MPGVRIVTDSTADLPAGVAEKYGIAVVPLAVNWDGQSYRDRIDMTTGQFYTRLSGSKSMPKTGAPSMGAFEETYRQLLDEGAESIVSVHISGKLSGTLGVAQSAASSVDARRIRTVDSAYVSLPLGWLAERGASMAEQGANAETIARALEVMVPRLRALFLLDTLEYLQKGGRIGKAAAMAGTLLNVKPILSIREGEVHPVERVRTSNAALKRLVELTKAMGPLERVGIIYGGDENRANEVEALLRPTYPDQTITRAEIGPVVGTYGGPGVIATCAILKE